MSPSYVVKNRLVRIRTMNLKGMFMPSKKLNPCDHETHTNCNDFNLHTVNDGL